MVELYPNRGHASIQRDESNIIGHEIEGIAAIMTWSDWIDSSILMK